MDIQEFSVDKMKSYSMWFMLDKIKDGPISLVQRTPTGDIPFGENKRARSAECFRMKDGRILIGLGNFMGIITKTNLYAISGDTEEIVNLQFFENICHKYNLDVNEKEKGYFVFVNSSEIPSKYTWRCDSLNYGPMNYGAIDGIEMPYIELQEEIIEYDNIFSVDGVSHLIYLHRVFDAPDRKVDFYSGVIPDTGLTIGEALKLISEWSIVADAPFNNNQLVSLKAKEFLNKLDFDISFVDYQSDMYVAEFLKGNTNARKRPENIQPLSPELDVFIKKKMSFHSLSALISMYPDSWNLQEIVDAEENVFTYIHDMTAYFILGFHTQNIRNNREEFLKKVQSDKPRELHHIKTLFDIMDRTFSIYNSVKATSSF